MVKSIMLGLLHKNWLRVEKESQIMKFTQHLFRILSFMKQKTLLVRLSLPRLFCRATKLKPLRLIQNYKTFLKKQEQHKITPPKSLTKTESQWWCIMKRMRSLNPFLDCLSRRDISFLKTNQKQINGVEMVK